MGRSLQLLLAFGLAGGASAAAPRPFLIKTPGLAPEPYAAVHGGSWTGKPVSPGSPDPMAGYTWASDAKGLNRSALQYYILAPIDASTSTPEPRATFRNVSSVIGVAGGAGMVVAGPAGAAGGSVGVTFDFGVETASWLELDVTGLSPGDVGKIDLASGEANQVTFVGGYKRGAPKAYTAAGGRVATLRLETNGELYEGMRYGFLNVTAPLTTPFVVTAVRAVVQVRPQNYAGSFFSAGDPLLEAVWWTGAYVSPFASFGHADVTRCPHTVAVSILHCNGWFAVRVLAVHVCSFEAVNHAVQSLMQVQHPHAGHGDIHRVGARGPRRPHLVDRRRLCVPGHHVLHHK